jgi:hypothetical protein
MRKVPEILCSQQTSGHVYSDNFDGDVNDETRMASCL